MKPFTHRTFIGNFFDVLAPERQGRPIEAPPFPTGGTRKREAAISLLSGNLDMACLPELAVALDNLLVSLVKLVVLDLSQVTLLSPNAAGILVNYQAAVQGRNKRLVLFRPSSVVMDVLSDRNLLHLFDIQLTEEELLLDLPD